MSDSDDRALRRRLTRRSLLSGSLGLVGTAALGALLRPSSAARAMPHFTPVAKRVIHLFMAGGPSQLETFDYKPNLPDGELLPESVRRGQRITSMMPSEVPLRVKRSEFAFAAHGSGDGTFVSELFPHTAGIVDKLCLIRSMHTEAINHDPAMTLMQTGSQMTGRPSMGAWLSYGLGDVTRDLPSFVVMLSQSRDLIRDPQPVLSSLWDSGFLPAQFQGTRFRSGPDPVLYATDGTGASREARRRATDTRAALDRLYLGATDAPEVAARIEAFELAHRMQTAAPEVTDVSAEPDSTFALYGEDARLPGTFAHNCVLARRLAEQDVPFIQLYHSDWDHHETIRADHPKAARDTDRAAAGLVLDLEARGLLEDTLVVWGGEFGRTPYVQNPSGDDYGRDHHPRCFPAWVAGGGVRPGIVHGRTDDYGYNVVEDPVHVHDLHATLLHQLGFDHERLTYRFAGRDFRLTDVAGRVLDELLL